MRVNQQKYALTPIGKLTPHPSNPRQGDVGAIHESIEANGFYGAIIFQKSTGYVIGGNHRLIAAQQAGAEKVPAIEVDCDDETALRILLADNRTNDLASYDSESLADILRELAETGDAITGTGYSLDDLDDLIADLQESQPLPNPDKNVGTDDTAKDRYDRYQNAATRSIMLDYSLERFRWMVDRLSELREEYGVENNSEAVRKLIEEATGQECPRD